MKPGKKKKFGVLNKIRVLYETALRVLDSVHFN